MKKLLMLTLMPLVLLVMMAPTIAKPIGPQKVPQISPEQWKNPHLTVTEEGATLLLPSGVENEWTADTGIGAMDFMHILNASKAKIRKAMPLTFENLTTMFTDPDAALEVENKWGYIPQEVIFQLLMWMGYPEDLAEQMASMWPEGAYAKFVNVGK